MRISRGARSTAKTGHVAIRAEFHILYLCTPSHSVCASESRIETDESVPIKQACHRVSGCEHPTDRMRASSVGRCYDRRPSPNSFTAKLVCLVLQNFCGRSQAGVTINFKLHQR